MMQRALRFVREQALNTAPHSSRLMVGPLVRFARSSLPLSIVSRFVYHALATHRIQRALYFAIGYELFQRDRPAAAWRWLKKYLSKGRPSTDDYLVGVMCLYHGLGRFGDAVALLTQANQRNLQEATKLEISNSPFRIVDSVWARHIGHTATLDYVIKLGILEGRSRDDTILYLPRGSPVANRFLLQQVSTHLRVTENAADLPIPAEALQSVHYDYLGPRQQDGSATYFWEVAAKVYRRWSDAGRGPLFTLPRDTMERGWAALRRAGLRQGAWFVALHVREGRWVGRNPGIHGFLNADLSAYLPAITEITRRGGWVIRMGDPGMPRLPPLEGVFDYCHSEVRADWMDIFIAACCRFMLGTSSGPAYIPPLYGVPCVLTNWWPPAQRPWHASDLFIPKMLRKQSDGRLLKLSQTLCEPFSYCHSRRFLANHCDVGAENNDPELIREAVKEMLDRLEGNAEQDPETVELRTMADRIYERHNALGMAALARGFVRRYQDLIS